VARNEPKGQYGEVVARLKEIVEALEAGELSLEDSLERFGEGINLVKQGEKLLADAEKRIEQLVSEDGRTAPLKVPETPELTHTSTLATPMATKAVRRQASAPPAPAPVKEASATGSDELDDVPF
jgi:exodeoxyribonuclease VII small subunit